MQKKQDNPAVVSLTRQTLNKILDTDVNVFSFKGSKAKNTDSKFHPPTLLLFFIKLVLGGCAPADRCLANPLFQVHRPDLDCDL